MGSFFLSFRTFCGRRQPLLQERVLYSLWRKRLHKEFPVFMRICLPQIAIVVVLLPSSTSRPIRFFTVTGTFLNWGASFIGFPGFQGPGGSTKSLWMYFGPHSMKDLGTILFRWGARVDVAGGSGSGRFYQSRHFLLWTKPWLRSNAACAWPKWGWSFLDRFRFASGIRWKHRSFGWHWIWVFATDGAGCICGGLDGRRVPSPSAGNDGEYGVLRNLDPDLARLLLDVKPSRDHNIDRGSRRNAGTGV